MKARFRLRLHPDNGLWFWHAENHNAEILIRSAMDNEAPKLDYWFHWYFAPVIWCEMPHTTLPDGVLGLS